MRAGSLRHTITVQRATLTPDDHGQPTRTWSKLATVPADITDSDGSEVVEGGGVTQQITHVFWLRYLPGLTPSDRFLYDGRTFNIHRVIDVRGRREKMRVLATEVL